MDFIKKHWHNVLFLIIVVLIIFMPFGGYVKVKLNQVKVLFSNPASIEQEQREMVDDFNWNLEDSDGKKINFQQMEGEIILVNFWATWCPPCVAEMPSLNELHKDYGNKIKFLFVANDTAKSVNLYLEKNNYNLPVYYASDKAPTELYSKSIPATFLIDAEGKIVMKEIGSSNWNSSNVRNQIDELLAFNLAE